MGVLDIVGGFITGGPVGAVMGFVKSIISPLSAIFTKIEDTRVQLAQADNERDKNILQAKLGVLQARADTMAKEAPYSRFNIYMRAAIAFGPMVLLNKIFVYDKALGQWTGGTTDRLDPNLWQVIMVVLGFYFLYEGVSMFKKP